MEESELKLDQIDSNSVTTELKTKWLGYSLSPSSPSTTTSSLRTGLVLSRLPHHPLMHLLEYIGKPDDFLHMLLVCKAWYDYFDPKDMLLWQLIALCYRIDTLHLPTNKVNNSRNSDRVIALRSRTNVKKLFLQAYAKKKREIKEKHDYLIIEAKQILDRRRDCAGFLKKLIYKMFPPQPLPESSKTCNNNLNIEDKFVDPPCEALHNFDCNSPRSVLSLEKKKKRKSKQQNNSNEYYNPDFDINWQCGTMEEYSLLALSARYCHLKCMKFLCDTFPAIIIDIKDMGGFTPLHICAYRGYLPGVQFCVKQGANLALLGRVRSGIPLSAEHWAAVQGNTEIFHYLRGIRLKLEALLKPKQSSASSSSSASTVNIQNPSNPGDHSYICEFSSKLLPSDDNVDEYADASRNTELSAAEIAITASCSTFHGTNQDPGSPHITQSSVIEASTPSSSSSQLPTSSILSPLQNNPATTYVRGEGVYCICGIGYFGEMVGCDMENCPIEWFHFECVGLTKEPEGEWICQACRGEAFLQPIRAKATSPLKKKKRKPRSLGPRKKKTSSTMGTMKDADVDVNNDFDSVEHNDESLPPVILPMNMEPDKPTSQGIQ